MDKSKSSHLSTTLFLRSLFKSIIRFFPPQALKYSALIYYLLIRPTFTKKILWPGAVLGAGVAGGGEVSQGKKRGIHSWGVGRKT